MRIVSSFLMLAAAAALISTGCGSSDTAPAPVASGTTSQEQPPSELLDALVEDDVVNHDAVAVGAGVPATAVYNLRFTGIDSPPFTSQPDSIQQAGFLPADSPQPTAFNSATQNGRGNGARAFTVQFGLRNMQPLYAGQQLPAASRVATAHAQVSYTEVIQVGSSQASSRLYVSSAGLVRILDLDVKGRSVRLQFVGVELAPRLSAPAPIRLDGEATYSF